MIKNLTPGNGININNNYSTWPSFYNTVSSTGNGLIGQLRYNGTSQNLEVFDGNTWLAMTSGYPTVELAPHVQAVVAWAQTKMAEESRMRELAATHPSVADALEVLEKAQDQVRIVAELVQE